MEEVVMVYTKDEEAEDVQGRHDDQDHGGDQRG